MLGHLINAFTSQTSVLLSNSPVSPAAHNALMLLFSIASLVCAAGMWKGMNKARMAFMGLAVLGTLYNWFALGIAFASIALVAIPLEAYYLFHPGANAFFNGTGPVINPDADMTLAQKFLRIIRAGLYSIGWMFFLLANIVSYTSVVRPSGETPPLAANIIGAIICLLIGLGLFSAAMAIKRFRSWEITLGNAFLLTAWGSAAAMLLTAVLSTSPMFASMQRVQTSINYWIAIPLIAAELLIAIALLRPKNAVILVPTAA